MNALHILYVMSILILVVLQSQKWRYKWDDTRLNFHIECAEMYIQKNMNILSSFALNRVLISDIDSSYMDKYAKYEFIHWRC